MRVPLDYAAAVKMSRVTGEGAGGDVSGSARAWRIMSCEISDSASWIGRLRLMVARTLVSALFAIRLQQTGTELRCEQLLVVVITSFER